MIKVEGGGLSIGNDGQMLSEKELRNLRKRIIATLKEFKSAIEDYEASVKSTGTDNGGKKSVQKLNLALFGAKLPECMEDHKDKLGAIKIKINTLFDTLAFESQQYFVDVITGITQNGVANADKIKPVACEKLIESLADNLVVESSEVLDDLGLGTSDPDYILCFTPAGKVYALPKKAKLIFTNTTQVPVPSGALTGYKIDSDWYFAHFKKQNGEWYFDGYYNGSGMRSSSYLTQEQLKNKLAKEDVNITTASLGVATLVLTPEQVLKIPTLNPALAGQLKNIGRLTGVALAASIVLELFVSTSSLEYGVGQLVLELPSTFSITEGYVEDVPESIPITIPISTTDFCPPIGECSVYVIYGQFTKGDYFVAKYGMTCQKDSKTNPNVNPRPACQVRRLNRTLAEQILDPLGTAEGNPDEETNQLNALKRPMVLKYYSARIIAGVDKTTALLIEKAMVASYLKVNGVLPPEQGLPNFGAKTKPIQEAINNAVKYLEDLTHVFK